MTSKEAVNIIAQLFDSEETALAADAYVSAYEALATLAECHDGMALAERCRKLIDAHHGLDSAQAEFSNFLRGEPENDGEGQPS